jgi:hypothetical protein
MVTVSAIAFGAFFARRLPRLFLAVLGVLLLGYAFFGRSFAYLGVPPLFVGEMVIALGLLAALVSHGVRSTLRSPLTWLVIMFGVWGALRTIPYVGTYRMNALRDAVAWAYSIITLLVAAFLPRVEWLSKVPSCYRRLLPWFVLWVPVGWSINHFLGPSLPRVPGSDAVSLITFKSGDAAVHLAGAAAFLLLGLQQAGERPGRAGFRVSEWAVWAIWLMGFVLVAATNRGGALASLVALFTVTLLRPAAARRKIPMVAVLAVALGLGVSVANTTSWSIVDRDREMSPRQIVVNLKSIAGTGGGNALEGSRRWRLAWWTRITQYTIHGDLFWTGKGFGINLADDDGFQVTRDHSLRSPHNAHLMLLARAGVPGLGLWLLLQGAFGLAMVRAYLRAQRARLEWRARVTLWVLAYWVAFLVNASFDVFLEGPQGGIWFWSLLGFGIVIVEAQRQRDEMTAVSLTRRPA